MTDLPDGTVEAAAEAIHVIRIARGATPGPICPCHDIRMATVALEAAAPLLRAAWHLGTPEDEAQFNQAIDWLLNSRHCGDPDIQSVFWGLADGELTREEADKR